MRTLEINYRYQNFHTALGSHSIHFTLSSYEKCDGYHPPKHWWKYNDELLWLKGVIHTFQYGKRCPRSPLNFTMIASHYLNFKDFTRTA